MDKDRLLELASEGTRAAKGAGDCDTLAVYSREASALIEKNTVKACEVEYSSGFSVRAMCRGGVGFARCAGLSAEEAREAGAEAVRMACEAEADPDFVALPEPERAVEPRGLFDSRTAEIEPSRVVGWCLECVEAAKEIMPDIVVKCSAGAGYSRRALANSRGVAVAEEHSSVGLSVVCVAKRGDDVGSYYDYTLGRSLADLKPPREVAVEAATRAVSLLGARKIPGGKYPALLGPHAASDLVRGVIDAADAESIQRKRSFLAGRRGERIAPSFFTVVEDPLFEAGIYSSAADGEGVPRRKAALIDSGVLTEYLHNSYTANKAGEPNNGHAHRSSHMSDVGIAATNISVAPGARTEAEIIAGMSRGLFILMASIAPHSVTGQISGTVDQGFWIENGEIAYPVKNVMIGGEIFEFLESIEEMSSDMRREPGNEMPSMLVGAAHISGGG
ncbi:MAG TPA: TldD/PmbA family protein [bacterium]|nr:TldD/PmbA family protein [bacterium]